jgi:hypothetical protein
MAKTKQDSLQPKKSTSPNRPYQWVAILGREWTLPANGSYWPRPETTEIWMTFFAKSTPTVVE